MPIKKPQQLLADWETQVPNELYLKQPVNGVYIDFTFKRVADEARRMAAALSAMGLEKGDKVGILSKNCAHWFLADLAIMLGGFISVPIYPTANRDTISYILEHSETKVLFVGKLDDWQQQQDALENNLPTIGFPYGESVTHDWDQLIRSQQPVAYEEPDWDDVMTLLYTSGSTGKPKAAVHTYRSFIHAGYLSGEAMQLGRQDRLLSYLPLAHCSERAYVQSSSLSFGPQIWFVESLETFSRDLVNTAPTMFGSVPRLWTQFQNKIHEQLPPKKLNRLLSIPLLNVLVKRKIKKSMGLHNAKCFLSSSAPLGEKLVEWYKKIDIPITEGWGMTETFAFGTILPVGEAPKTGTIGKPGKGVDIKVADNGEIIIKSPSLMQGYYKLAEANDDCFTDGYFRTGDKGVIDAEGFVKITGRIKEIFKTAKGKYVAPAKLEGLIAENPYIDQQCVIGSGLKQPVALIQLTENAKQIDREELTQSLEQSFIKLNASLEKHEKLSAFYIAKEPWTIEAGLITPTLKIKRQQLEEKYRERLSIEFEHWLIWEPEGSPVENSDESEGVKLVSTG